MKQIGISSNGRFFQQRDGSPFFWLADTAWELLHRLSREEICDYLDLRRRQGFNTVQTVLLAENDGLRTPNFYGRHPLLTNAQGRYDPSLPDLEGPDSCWALADFLLEEAAKRGMLVALLPTWGDKWNKKFPAAKGPEVFTPDNAFAYGAFTAGRFRQWDNLVYVLGGDRTVDLPAHREILDRHGPGYPPGGPGGPAELSSMGPGSSYAALGQPDWLGFHMLQTGHFFDRDSYRMMEQVYNATAGRPLPVLDGEPRYEDHPIQFDPRNGRFDAWDLRQACYWSVFAGGCGVTYGHNCVWGMIRPGEENDYWDQPYCQAMERPGAWQMRHLKELMLSRPFFQRRPAQELLCAPLSWQQRLQAARGDRYAMVYDPDGAPVRIQGGLLPGSRLWVRWMDPETGNWSQGAAVPNQGQPLLSPPRPGPRRDWVLTLDSLD